MMVFDEVGEFIYPFINHVCTIVMLFSYLEHHYVIKLSRASLCYLVIRSITMLLSYLEHHYVIKLSRASLCYLVIWNIIMLFSYLEHHYVI